MKRNLVLFFISCVCLAAIPAQAHRLDEYLQATILSLEPGKISLTMRLVPGMAVSEQVITGIDSNGDGVLSGTEQTAYVERVMSDIVLTENGKPLTFHLVRAAFPSIAQMR